MREWGFDLHMHMCQFLCQLFDWKVLHCLGIPHCMKTINLWKLIGGGLVLTLYLTDKYILYKTSVFPMSPLPEYAGCIKNQDAKIILSDINCTFESLGYLLLGKFGCLLSGVKILEKYVVKYECILHGFQLLNVHRFV